MNSPISKGVPGFTKATLTESLAKSMPITFAETEIVWKKTKSAENFKNPIIFNQYNQ